MVQRPTSVAQYAAMPSRLVLYVDPFWISPYVFSAFVALSEKELPFETATVDLTRGEHRREPFRSLSLTSRVPALNHDGFSLSESSAIAEYLEEMFPPPAYSRILPGDPRQRARARQVMAFVRSDLGPLRDERSTETVFYERPRAALSEAGRRSAQKLTEIAERLIPEKASTAFGDWSIADLDLAMALRRLDGDGDLLPPRLRDYVAAQWARPSVRAYVDHPRGPFVPYNY